MIRGDTTVAALEQVRAGRGEFFFACPFRALKNQSQEQNRTGRLTSILILKRVGARNAVNGRTLL
jgi:hypothetical protein